MLNISVLVVCEFVVTEEYISVQTFHVFSTIIDIKMKLYYQIYFHADSAILYLKIKIFFIFCSRCIPLLVVYGASSTILTYSYNSVTISKIVYYHLFKSIIVSSVI